MGVGRNGGLRSESLRLGVTLGDTKGIKKRDIDHPVI